MRILDIIMVVGADLTGTGRSTQVGPELSLVCDRALDIYRCCERQRLAVRLVATAGYSSRHRVFMNQVIRRALIKRGIPAKTILAPWEAMAKTFDTWGEMVALTTWIARTLSLDTQLLIRVHLVCRWWHLPRARYLFYLHLPAHIRGRVEVYPQPAQSREGWRERAMERIRWIKLILRLLKGIGAGGQQRFI